MSFLIKSILAVSLLSLLFSCEVVTLDTDGQILDEMDESINAPSSYPDSDEALQTILSGVNSNSWSSAGFMIEGITGFQGCRMDDTIILNANGSFTYDGGDVLCGAEDDQRLKTGTWSMNYIDRTLTVNSEEDGEFSLNIESATADEIIISSFYFGLEVLGRFERSK